jgi:lipid A 3-O-deacylase
MLKRSICSGLVLLLLCCAFASAEAFNNAFDKGTWDIRLWGGGGGVLHGSRKDTQVLISGLGFGKHLTHIHGSGVFRGSFEYAVEVITLFLVFQQTTRTAGFSFTPLLMKWDCLRTNGQPRMFLEVGAGMAFTSSQVPIGASRFNFTPQTGIGFYFGSRTNRAASLELKYIHISNAGLYRHNPGINTVDILLGFHWFH